MNDPAEILNMIATDAVETAHKAKEALPSSAMVLPLDLAFIRWSVVCTSWGELSAGNAPLLTAFLAGWSCRCIGSSQPQALGIFRDSFRVGWREADTMIAIETQRQNIPALPEAGRNPTSTP